MSRYRGLFLLFFLSGISGLIYESIWSRYIRLFVGSAATAQVLVLSLFMGGMSLGALIAARKLASVRSPVRTYGLIEGGIGLYALLFPTIAELVMRFCYDAVFPAVGSASMISLIKWTMAALMILPPCVLLGMTFPLMSAGILRQEPDRSGEILSLLYFTNSLGAALGAVVSGFVLVTNFGLPGTLVVAAILNLLIFAVAVRKRETFPPMQVEEKTTEAAGGKLEGFWLTVLLALGFGTGLSSFMYEIGWIRMLSMIIGSATHSFEVMLSAFIFGLAAGGLWVRRRMDKFRRPELVLGLVQLLMGMAAIATLPLYRLAVEAMGGLLTEHPSVIALFDAEHHPWITWVFGEKPEWVVDLFGGGRNELLWSAFNVLRYILCLLIMLPATFCAGMTLPLLTHVLLRRGQPEGVIGKVYGLNTLGSIVGAVTAGLLLMPLIGLKNVIVIGAAVDIGLGILLIVRERRHGKPLASLRRTLITASVGGGAMLFMGLFVLQLDPMVMTSTVYRNGRTRLPDDDYTLLSYVDGRTASVSVVDRQSHAGYRVLYANGKPDATVIVDHYPEGRKPEFGPDLAGDEPTQMLLGVLPIMARPHAKNVALIGFGSGVSAHTALGSPNLERLDTIEIEPEMIRGSEAFKAVNHRAYEDPRSHLWIDDAKAFFAGEARAYDIIISEPTNPWVSGVSSLFTLEFYVETKRYLADDGILVQWLQGYELSDTLTLTVLAALDREFADYLILRVGFSDWIIMSSPTKRLGQLSDIPLAWVDDPSSPWSSMQKSFELLGIHDIAQVDSLMVANRELLHPFLDGKPANSDAYPLLDTGAEKDRFMKHSAGLLHSIRWTPAPLLEVLGNLERRPYPKQGIGDLRDPHVLFEAEQAALLMRVYDNPDTPRCSEAEEPDCEFPSAVAMDLWLEQQAALDDDDPNWNLWTDRTYNIFRKTAPHIDLAATPWWEKVLAVGRHEDTPNDLARAIELLDALIRREGPRLMQAIEAVRAHRDDVLSKGLVAIATMVALELTHAPQQTRDTLNHEIIDPLVDNNGTSEDLAFQALQMRAQIAE